MYKCTKFREKRFLGWDDPKFKNEPLLSSINNLKQIIHLGQLILEGLAWRCNFTTALKLLNHKFKLIPYFPFRSMTESNTK